ncbi:hypothetical protein [Desulfosporosinus lacus]|uniref:Uncharacterized protein n=1 Tax=Desulfosporosinus lacus DSM 15449 TaxID=1121420 RepID=A0A1M5V018_9FIRM|nr:hypothetical protein [Desulfosporosinus lacus]SHH68581.1 hypothetical protein SAMN02746098_01141 [Desulfosporosinus lacus DSM 15449]
MEQINIIMQKDYERATLLLGDLFEIDSDIIEQINCCIQNYGIGSFFKNLKTFDFPADVAEKLNAVGMVLYGMSEESLPVAQIFKEPKGGAIYEKKL